MKLFLCLFIIRQHFYVLSYTTFHLVTEKSQLKTEALRFCKIDLSFIFTFFVLILESLHFVFVSRVLCSQIEFRYSV
jgi:hypothetical protein